MRKNAKLIRELGSLQNVRQRKSRSSLFGDTEKKRVRVVKEGLYPSSPVSFSSRGGRFRQNFDILIFRYCSYRTKESLMEYRTNIAIGLQQLDQQHWASDSPIEIYRKKGDFHSCFFAFLHKFLPFGRVFREGSFKTKFKICGNVDS